MAAHALAAHALVATAITLAEPALAQRRMPLIAPSPSRTAPLTEPLAPAQALPVQPAAVVPSPPDSSAPPARLNTGLVTIESDLQRADQVTGVVTATGNVRIVYPDQRVVATARQAQYFSKEGRVVLSGDVDIVQEGGNLMRAEQVVYLVNAERLTAIPPAGQQVFSRMRIQTQPNSPGAPRP
jgi:lipopolysaccharide export system protein LptA